MRMQVGILTNTSRNADAEVKEVASKKIDLRNLNRQQQQPKPSQSTPTSLVEKTFKLNDNETSPSSPPSKPVEKDESLIVAIVEKPMTETKEPDRIVWTYHAAPVSLSKKERRCYEADHFWLNTRPEYSVKQVKIKQLLDEKISTVEENQVFLVVVKSTCETLMNICANKEEERSPSSPSGVGDSANKASRPLFTRSYTNEESDADSLQSLHFSPKAVDMPSAIRLSKRLYMLDGFHKSDVSRHLSRNNEFNRVVAEEYLEHFNFVSLELGAVLRLLLNAFQLTGVSSEQDGFLVHFSRHYIQSNPTSSSSQDEVYNLTCALLLLYSDLHGKHPGMKRMTCTQFIKRLSGLNDGGDFPVDLLRRLYNAIKEHPLEWATDAPEGGISPADTPPAPSEMSSSSGITPNVKELASNPYLTIPTPSESQEFKKGYIMRKCCAEPGGKRTSLGKRSWKMYFAVLKILCLYLYKDESTFKGETPAKSSTPCCKNKTAAGSDQLLPATFIRVHHALAASAPDYTKKKNVFRLFTSDRAQFLIQASDAKEWRCWMDGINTAADGSQRARDPIRASFLHSFLHFEETR